MPGLGIVSHVGIGALRFLSDDLLAGKALWSKFLAEAYLAAKLVLFLHKLLPSQRALTERAHKAGFMIDIILVPQTSGLA